jgi:hypothetical protein
MKKFYLTGSMLIGLFFIGINNSNAQDLIVGGNMENAADWTVVDIAAGNGHTETFNYTDDGPTGGSGGCLSMAGSGNWSNAAVCQAITVQRGSRYLISMNVKTAVDFVVQSDWLEIVVMDKIPATDAEITAFTNSLALNTWDCPDVLSVDGNLADFNCDAKSALKDTINIEGTGDTTVVLVIKAGGNNEYNILIDDVKVLKIEGGGSSVHNTLNSSLSVFPNPAGNEINISLNNTIQNIQVVNIIGQVVYSAENVGLNNVDIDFSTPKAGVYYVVVTDINGNTSTVKTIKL